MPRWNLNLNNLSQGGFAPDYFKSDYVSFANKNQSSQMVAMDLTNPNHITAGPVFTDVTLESTITIDALVKGFTENTIIDSANDNLIKFAIGNTIYALKGDTAVEFGTSDRDNIASGGVGEDGIIFQGDLYWTWYDGTDGDIGKYDIGSDTLTASWATGSYSKNLNKNIPMQIARIGFEPQFVFLNGDYVGKYDAIEDDLNDAIVRAPGSSSSASGSFTQEQLLTSIVASTDRFYVSAYSPGNWVPSAAGTFNPAQHVGLDGEFKGTVYKWDGASAAFDSEIFVDGIPTALYNLGNIIFVFYLKERLLDGTLVSAVGFINGSAVQELETYEGASPIYYQVTDMDGYLVWTWDADGEILAYGASHTKEEPRIFQFSSLAYGTNSIFNEVGGISFTGGSLHIGYKGNSGSKIGVADSSVVPVIDSEWWSRIFGIRGRKRKGIIERVLIEFDPITVDQEMVVDFFEDDGVYTTPIKTITLSVAHADIVANDTVFTLNEEFPSMDNLIIKLSSSNSQDNTVNLRSIYIEGRTHGD